MAVIVNVNPGTQRADFDSRGNSDQGLSVRESTYTLVPAYTLLTLPSRMINTRTVTRADGSLEIVRILDESLLGRWSPDQPVSYESSILWFQPLDGLDFVRVAWVRNAKSRRGPLIVSGANMVLGYSKLTDDAPIDPVTQSYTRRLFYLREEDSLLNMNQFPKDSIDPHTILPGYLGDLPRVEVVERGYPRYISRSELGLAPPVLPTT